MNKVYFISDFHLGMNGKIPSREREAQVIRWLDMAGRDASEIYLLGDVFDFWFEYKHVVPKGYIRLLGKLAELADKGIPIHYFTGNHDMWMFGYLTQEIGIKMYYEAVNVTIQGKKLQIGHGDGLGPGDHRYKFIKKLFASPICRFLFKWIHPDMGIGIANFFSHSSRNAQQVEQKFLGPDHEWLIQHCEASLKNSYTDFFIFGHRHLVIDYILSNGKSRYVNLGDWLYGSTYAVLENGELTLENFIN